MSSNTGTVQSYPRSKTYNANNVIYVYDAPNGCPRILGINADQIVALNLIVPPNGIVEIQAPLTGLTMAPNATINLADGTPLAPSLSFGTNTNTGFYVQGGSIGVNVSGNNVATFSSTQTVINAPLAIASSITTTSGDLSLNPIGGNVNFNGKNLVNVGTIVTNPYSYPVYANPDSGILTTDATPSPLLTIGIPSGSSITAKTTIICTNLTNMTDSSSISNDVKIKNIGGVVSFFVISEEFAYDSSMTGISYEYVVGVNSVVLNVIGLSGTNIRWNANSNVIIQAFN